MNNTETIEPIVTEIEIVETDLERQVSELLGRWQVLVALLILIPQLLIIFAVLDVAEGLSPLAAVGTLAFVQAAMLTNHQMDTRAGVRLVIDALQAIDFEDDDVDELVDETEEFLENLGIIEPDVIESIHEVKKAS